MSRVDKKLTTLLVLIIALIAITTLALGIVYAQSKYRLKLRILSLSNKTLTDVLIKIYEVPYPSGKLVKELREPIDSEYVADLSQGNYDVLVTYNGILVGKFTVSLNNDTEISVHVNVTDAVFDFYDQKGEKVRSGLIKLILRGTNFAVSNAITDGRVSFANIPTGDYTIKVNVYNITVLEKDIAINRTAKNYVQFHLKLGDLVMLLNDIRGKSITHGIMYLKKEGRLVVSKATSSGGTIIVEDVPYGRYEVEINVRGITVYNASLQVSKPEVDLIIRCNVTTLSVKVVDAQGKEVLTTHIRMISRENRKLVISLNNTSKGMIRDLPLGEYRLIACRDSVTFYNKTLQVNEHLQYINITCPTYSVTIEVPQNRQKYKLLIIDLTSNSTQLVSENIGSVKLYPGKYVLVLSDDFDRSYTVMISKDTTIRVRSISSSLKVVLTNSKGAPIAGAKVIILREGEIIKQGTTNAEGIFSITGLTSGEYRVQITIGGKLVYLKPLTITGGNYTIYINVSLGMYRSKLIKSYVAIALIVISAIMIILRDRLLGIMRRE